MIYGAGIYFGAWLVRSLFSPILDGVTAFYSIHHQPLEVPGELEVHAKS